MNICLHSNFRFSDVTDLAVQLFEKVKRKKKKIKNLRKNIFLSIYHILCQTYLGKFFLFFMFKLFFNRNGNNLKLKVKSEFSSMCFNVDKL